MTAKDIIKTVCIFLQKEELLQTQQLDGETQATSQQDKEIEHLVRCLNLVQGQIACEFIPLLTEQSFAVENNKIDLTSLTKTLVDVVCAEDEFGAKIPFKLFPSHIKIACDRVKLTYSYLPSDITSLSSEVPNFSGRVTERVFAYGVAMEYCFICGLHDDAQIWEKRFKDSLLITARKKAEIRLPKRRWI